MKVVKTRTLHSCDECGETIPVHTLCLHFLDGNMRNAYRFWVCPRCSAATFRRFLKEMQIPKIKRILWEE